MTKEAHHRALNIAATTNRTSQLDSGHSSLYRCLTALLPHRRRHSGVGRQDNSLTSMLHSTCAGTAHGKTLCRQGMAMEPLFPACSVCLPWCHAC